ncbi:MAG: Gfo/Idh/MocA family oxidoreductase [Syntrophobacteraceae bacterium]|nr:Gfo/Idh/MocA family oxidoreductase [Syntrophobacteraceae bacterium]
MIRVGIVGYGYWGPNIARNFERVEGCRVVRICDSNPDALERVRKSLPGIDTSTELSAVVKAPDIDAVAIVTPVSTHFELARQALENGKHVFVEKPFTSNSDQALRLIEIAERKNLKLMIDHTFLFTGAVRKIKQLVEEGVLGKLYYYDSTRVNLGLFQHDVNVIWDLAPHDISIMNYVIGQKPEAVVATGGNHVCEHEYVAYVTIYFPDNVIAHVNVNWLSPVKVRTTLLGGEKKMVVWNDLDADEKVKVYDKGVEIGNRLGVYDLLVSYRSGDMWSPKLDPTEALKLETQEFIDCIQYGTKPLNDGWAGYTVVQMLEAADKSLKNRGGLIYM